MPSIRPSINESVLRTHAAGYETFLATEGVGFREERAAKDRVVKELFEVDALARLDEGHVLQLVKTLWSFNNWTNKDYPATQMLQSGIEVIRKAFRQLAHGPGTLAERFDAVHDHIRAMGTAAISEVLAHLDHTRYPIWNSRARSGLQLIGVPASMIPKGSQADGDRYEKVCELMRGVRERVATVLPSCTDLFELDLLLYYLSREVEAPTAVEPSSPAAAAPRQRPVTEVLRHAEVIDLLLELGDGLGFQVQKEYPVTAGCRIDVLWQTRVANLGTIGYAFEVHHHGSRDSAILNLQRVRRDASIQKVVLVSSRGELEALRREIEYLDEGFRRAVGFMETGAVVEAHSHMSRLKETLNEIGLLKPLRI